MRQSNLNYEKFPMCGAILVRSQGGFHCGGVLKVVAPVAGDHASAKVFGRGVIGGLFPLGNKK